MKLQNKSHTPIDWKLQEMKLRKEIRQELKKIKNENHEVWEKLVETLGGDVQGHQDAKEYGIDELKSLYNNLNKQTIQVTEAAEYASTLSEQLLDENNFEMRNAHGFNTMKRNSKYLGKLSEELQKVNDALNSNKMQALALIDEIGMIAHRYYGKK